MRADVLMSTMLAPISNTDFPKKNALFCYPNSSDGGVQTDRSRPSQCSQEHRSDYGKTSSARLQCHFQAPLINKRGYEVNFSMEHAYLQVASPESLESLPGKPTLCWSLRHSKRMFTAELNSICTLLFGNTAL
jgi:hypothetical protein